MINNSWRRAVKMFVSYKHLTNLTGGKLQMNKCREVIIFSLLSFSSLELPSNSVTGDDTPAASWFEGLKRKIHPQIMLEQIFKSKKKL